MAIQYLSLLIGLIVHFFFFRFAVRNGFRAYEPPFAGSEPIDKMI
jgi:hypothetical protein